MSLPWLSGRAAIDELEKRFVLLRTYLFSRSGDQVSSVKAEQMAQEHAGSLPFVIEVCVAQSARAFGDGFG